MASKMHIPHLSVNRSGVHIFENLDTKGQADLISLEGMKNIPFSIRRAYYLSGFKNPAPRGGHAHIQNDQIIVCLHGSFELSLHDGVQSQVITMSNPRLGMRLKPMLWHVMQNFTADCVILVLASELYEEKDYIRDWDIYLRLSKEAERIEDGGT